MLITNQLKTTLRLTFNQSLKVIRATQKSGPLHMNILFRNFSLDNAATAVQNQSTEKLNNSEEQQNEVIQEEEQPSFLAEEKPKEKNYVDIDITPKSFMHMTAADFVIPTKEQAAMEVGELIKEAREKIKPVLKVMSDEELKSIIKSIDDVKGDKQVIINESRFFGMIRSHGITLEELRRIQDKHYYEVDIVYELTRDLFEKQRVIDLFLQEHPEDDRKLNSYYQNGYAKHVRNKHHSLIYKLPYTPLDLRFNYRMMVFSTTVVTACLGMVHPALTVLMGYDWYMLFKGLQILNQTCEQLVLERGKRHIMVSKLNFLGYERQPEAKRISLRGIRYLGLFENQFATTHHQGLPPSFQKMFRAKDGQDTSSEDSKDEDKSAGHFRHFHKFMADNETYLISIDHPNHEEYISSQELLMAIIKGKQSRVLDYDFSEEEAVKEKAIKQLSEEMKDIMSFKQMQFEFEDDALRRKYCNFLPNRELKGTYEEAKLKKVDDGTFIDNGYR